MGRKQSPFIGRRVPLVDNGVPVLYPRYTSVDDILVDGAAAEQKKRAAPDPDTTSAAAATAPNGTAEQPAAKKSKQEQQQQQPEKTPAANGDTQQQQQQQPENEQQLSKKEKKRLRQQQQHGADDTPPAADPAAPAAAAATAAAVGADDAAEAAAADQKLNKKERRKLKRQQQQLEQQQQQGQQQQQQEQQQGSVPGPEDKGNAEEAARIRQVLGFTAATAAAGSSAQPPAAAVAAVPKVSSGGGFTFNFSNLSAEEAVAADTEAKLAAITAVDTADKDGFIPRRVFVGGMPYSYSREQIEEYWGWCGAVEDLDLMTFPDTGRFRGIAFITFQSQEGADAALACDGEQLEGHTLKVERCKAAAVAKQLKASVASAKDKHQQQQQQQQQRGRHQHQQQQQQSPAAAAGGVNGYGPSKTQGYNVAYVGNIAFEARPEDISALFEACNVTKVRLHTDKDTRKSKGYAHVHFADEAGLEQAISLSGTHFMGRAIKVSYGQPKKA